MWGVHVCAQHSCNLHRGHVCKSILRHDAALPGCGEMVTVATYLPQADKTSPRVVLRACVDHQW